MTQKQNSIAKKLKALHPSKAKAILAKVSFEQIESAGCAFGCTGHNVVKHNKRY